MMNLSQVKWPIYTLNKHIELKTYNNIILARNSSDQGFRLLDTIDTDTLSLGLRRIKYKAAPSVENFSLYKLYAPIYRYSDVFQYLSDTHLFIDSSGKIINYITSRYAPLKYHKIIKFREVYSGYIIYVRDIDAVFFMNREPSIYEHYAAILHIGKGYALYGLSEKVEDNFRRRI